MSSYCKKTELSKNGELRYGEDLSAPKISSLFKTSIYLSSLFLLTPTSSYAAIHLLPDVQNEEQQNILSDPPKASIDSLRCEKAGYTYYASGKCPAYHNQESCIFSDRYLKCDAQGWCLDNGYSKTSCTSPKVVDTQCPNGTALYKNCVCPNSYAYTCTGTGYSSGNGTVCESKYTKCNCSTNYVWSGSACVCDSSFKYSCSGSGYSSGSGTFCGGKYKSCNCASLYSWTGSACVHTHSYSCPSGYKTSSSGMISPVSTSKICACGATSGTCYKEGHSHSYSCPSGYSSSCSYGYSSTTSQICSCGATSGTCYSCNSAPACTSSSSNYCPHHGSCHGDCCKDGTYQSCDTRCGGNGCSTSSSSSSSGGSSSQADYYFWCCDSNCSYDECYSRVGRSCSNNDSYTSCTGSKIFQKCVGPSTSFYNPLTGVTDTFSHTGSLYFCSH